MIAPRVLHFVYNLMQGGTEGQCARIAMACTQAGCDHHVVVFSREGYFLHQVESVCGPVLELAIRHMVSSHTIRQIKRLKDHLKYEQFDVVHCWDADAVIFGSLAAQWAGIPYLTSRRDLEQIYPVYKVQLMRRADRRARCVVVNAEVIRQKLIRNGLKSDKLIKVPNVVDINEFDIAAGQPFAGEDSLPDGRWIVMVARLDVEKDIGTMIKAMSRIISQHSDINLLLAGDGPERIALERTAQAEGVSERVIFLGNVENVPALLRKATMAVLTPSHNEGLSNSILEYMVAGLPVVATDCGGNRELVRDGETGFLVSCGDPIGLADAVGRILASPEDADRMGRAGRRYVEMEHRLDRMVNTWLNIYRQYSN